MHHGKKVELHCNRACSLIREWIVGSLVDMNEYLLRQSQHTKENILRLNALLASYVRFSRKARASVAMSTVYLGIMASAFFYKARDPVVINPYFPLSLIRMDPNDVSFHANYLL